jgi:hypothetical protein
MTKTGRSWALGALVVTLFGTSSAVAQVFPNAPIRREKVPCELENPQYRMIREQYYGYYPTCWRRFPPGWGCLSPDGPNWEAEKKRMPLDEYEPLDLDPGDLPSDTNMDRPERPDRPTLPGEGVDPFRDLLPGGANPPAGGEQPGGLPALPDRGEGDPFAPRDTQPRTPPGGAANLPDLAPPNSPDPLPPALPAATHNAGHPRRGLLAGLFRFGRG